METLRGIFPAQDPPPKRDFLKENVLRIRRLQESRRNSAVPKNKPLRARKFNYCDSVHRLDRLSVEASKPPMTSNLRKSASCASICRDDSTQTTDINDEMFLKDVIIRFPSASLIRRPNKSPVTVQSQTQTQIEPKEPEKQYNSYQSYSHEKQDQNSEKMDRQLTDLSEFLERATISKKVSRPSSSILKNSNSNFVNVKSKSVVLNESTNNSRNVQNRAQVKEKKAENGDVIVISDEDDLLSGGKHSEKGFERSEKPQVNGNQTKDNREIVNDPDCPENHVPLTENERLEALQIAKKRFKVLVDELNRLPMTCETLRVRNRKIAIEKELRKLDEHIIVFSRSKVYIKVA